MEELWPVLPKFFQKTEKERTGANSFYEALPHFFPTEPNKGKERNLLKKWRETYGKINDIKASHKRDQFHKKKKINFKYKGFWALNK